MYLRPYTSTPADGSRTLTAHDSPPEESTVIAANPSANETPTRTVGTLRLRGGLLVPATRQRVAWDEDVVDNEGCGRKSSKICCIYHKPKRFDESSDSDSSGDESDSSCDGFHSLSRRPADRDRGERGGSAIHELDADAESNAYEVVPVPTKGKWKAQKG